MFFPEYTRGGKVDTLTLNTNIREFPKGNALVRRAAKGDVSAFEELYRQSVGRVYAVCLRMTGDSALAEDLTQEAYVLAWQNLGEFRSDSAFETWLHRIAVNVVIGDIRKVARRELRELQSRQAVGQSTESPTQDSGVKMDLESAIRELPEGAREVFVLHDVEGHKHPEIAAMLGIATGTSKAHLHRARMLLRERLER